MSLDPTSQLAGGLFFAIVLMAGLWTVQCFTRDAGIVDVGWSGSLGLLALYFAVTFPQTSWRTLVVAGIAAIWSLRLALHLLRDRIIGKSEDGRYQKLRVRFGTHASAFFFAFFELQAILAWLFSLSFWFAMRREDPIDVWDFFGLTIWGVAIFGESIADAQLADFRANPQNRGKTCRHGLWRFSRHPNYFFEWLHWWSYVVIAWFSPTGWITLFAPALMLFFLLKVTGIPPTEAQAVVSRGDDYRDYQRTTSMFVPWFPKA